MFSELYEFSNTSDMLGRPPCWGNAFIPTLRVVINLHPAFRSLAKEDHSSQASSDPPVMRTQCHPVFIIIALISVSK